MWSFVDVELLAGYQIRFGLYHEDFDDKELRRRSKLSAHWYSKFLKNIKEKKMERGGVNSMPLSAQQVLSGKLCREAYYKCNVHRGLKWDS